MRGPEPPSRKDVASHASSTVSTSIPERAKWPERLKQVTRDLLDPRDEFTREQARGETWLILNGAISLYLRLHATGMGQITKEDLEDLAAEKSLHVLRRIESGKTDFCHPLPSEIASFRLQEPSVPGKDL